MRNTFIFNDHNNDHTEIVQEESVLVIKGKRDELLPLSLKELKQPGVYFLLSNDFLYVGQSGKSVFNRLVHHLSKRSWWTDYLVITDDKGELEKTMTEFIEGHYITKLRANGVIMDNDTDGNSTVASRFTLSKITSIVHIADRLIADNHKVDLFKIQEGTGAEPTHLRTKIIDENGNVFSGSSLFKSFNLLILDYAKDPFMYSKLIMNEDEKGAISSIGGPSYIEVAEDLFLKKMSTKETEAAIKEYSEILDIRLTVTEANTGNEGDYID